MDILDLQKQYSAGEEPSRAFQDALLTEAYRWALATRYVDNDEASEFYLSLYGQACRIIKQFNPKKGGFRNYLSVCFRNHALHNIKNKNRIDDMENIYTRYISRCEKTPYSLAEDFSEYSSSIEMDNWIQSIYGKISTLPSRYQRTTKRRLLILFLYNFVNLPQQYLSSLASILDVSLDQFQKWTALLHRIYQKALKKWEENECKINQLFVSYRLNEILELKTINPERKEVYKRKKHYYKLRLDKSRSRRINLQVTASHKILADLLEIPSGTIGSSIYYARKFLAPLSLHMNSH